MIATGNQRSKFVNHAASSFLMIRPVAKVLLENFAVRFKSTLTIHLLKVKIGRKFFEDLTVFFY